ncbi:low-density lipoprotein receptor-related protein 8-like isoform X2 [Mya arenaria]|uniref:low-density lipoprotein receptor-related protein 8-like isoform X2 n=1 Tax=Mya arenaria TaxID=6604 RepID=UPI0022DEEAE7|nr:low-density lipoprotein receptor-related protein 8-like isoform X2 [Mya arenaria]
MQVSVQAFLLPWIVQLFDDSAMDKCLQAGNYYCNISGKCIYQSSVCDGVTDCKEREDESPPACTEDECFRRDRTLCGDFRCIPTSSLCDRKVNCPGGEDERFIACCLKHQCESNRSLLFGCLGECKPGQFGEYCEKTCSEKCLNRICDKSSGICKNCTRTYLENCSQECGEECRERNGFSQCDRQSGKCLNCCTLNHYGHYCNNTCKNCKGNSSNIPCDINGVCQFGCENDYWDKRCNSKCNANCQGDEHGKRCTSTGECINGCTRGWSGNLCGESTDKENVSSLKTTVIVIPVIATVVVVVVGIICYFWGRKRFNRH